MKGEEVSESLFKTYVEVRYVKAKRKKAEKGPKGSIDSRKNKKPVQPNIRWKECNNSIAAGKVEVTTLASIFNKRDYGSLTLTYGMEAPLFGNLVKKGMV